MPPPIPPHFTLAKKRMRQGLHPAVIAAAQRAIEAEKAKIVAQQGGGVHLPASVIAAGDRALRAGPEAVRRYNANIPRPGASNQVLMGEIRAGGRRQGTPVDARSQIDPIAGAKGLAYLQRDPEGGIRQVNVYNTGGHRVVRAFNKRGPVDPALLERLRTSQPPASTARQHLSNTATAEDKLLAIAARRAAAGAGGKGLPKKRVFNYRGGGLSRNV